MRWTKTLIPTLREDPQEAEIDSHKLLLRAGLIRKLAGGLYTFLPLGLRVLHKVERIVREEMDRAGALEILMPALHPREIWERSGRYSIMGDVMFRLADRQKKDFVLGPTHEEIVTELAAGELRSYRLVPRTFYQIQAKFRDEIRPRFGLMRAKEFIMKDAYSFDVDSQAADASYDAMYQAYVRIFKRCGIRTKVVEADTGAMGGKWSHEFMVLADSGEDGLVECTSCSYAANLERAERQPPEPAVWETGDDLPEPVATPGQRTIEEVAAFLKCKPAQLIKTMIYRLDGKPAAILVPGDREINEHKLPQALNVREAVLADEATIASVTGAPVGFAGPIGLTIPVYADLGLKGIRGGVTGANRADPHTRHVSLDRDAAITAYADLCVVKGGDRCPRCGADLAEQRGIEVGHVFKLGTKYTEAFNASFLDENGHQQTLIMGCYGIGVTRTLQSIIEQSRDANGIIWPTAVAPYPVIVLPMNVQHEPTMAVVNRLVGELETRGIEVLVDDRDERPGVKFKDSDLVGFPIRVVVGERGLAKQQVEIKRRRDTQAVMSPLDEALTTIVNMIQHDTQQE